METRAPRKIVNKKKQNKTKAKTKSPVSRRRFQNSAVVRVARRVPARDPLPKAKQKQNNNRTENKIAGRPTDRTRRANPARATRVRVRGRCSCARNVHDVFIAAGVGPRNQLMYLLHALTAGRRIALN